MSANASADPRDEPSSSSAEYDQMLELLDDGIAEAHRKIESGRVYDAENEKVRIKWIRALAYAVNVRRQVTVDRDLEQLTEDVERLKEENDL